MGAYFFNVRRQVSVMCWIRDGDEMHVVAIYMAFLAKRNIRRVPQKYPSHVL